MWKTAKKTKEKVQPGEVEKPFECHCSSIQQNSLQLDEMKTLHGLKGSSNCSDRKF